MTLFKLGGIIFKEIIVTSTQPMCNKGSLSLLEALQLA